MPDSVCCSNYPNFFLKLDFPGPHGVQLIKLSLFKKVFISSFQHTHCVYRHTGTRSRTMSGYFIGGWAQSGICWCTGSSGPWAQPSLLCLPLLLLPSIFLSIRVFSNESALCIRWSNYWSFSFRISPSNEYSELISFSIRLVWSPCCPRDSQESSPTPQFESINSSALSLLCSPALTFIRDCWTFYQCYNAITSVPTLDVFEIRK